MSSYHDERLARRLEDPEFREEFERQRMVNDATTTCDREVTRDGMADPCGKRATGVAYHEGYIYPACNAHRMSSAALLAAYLMDRAW